MTATLDRFEIRAELGRGKMGVLYRAFDPIRGGEVALKVLPAEAPLDRERLERFRREARMLAAVSHPNIAALYEVGESGGVQFLVLELVDGLPLKAVLREGRLTLARSLEIGIAVANGMAAAHDEGVVHRDLNPGNVMVTRADEVKIVDFGLAKQVPQASYKPGVGEGGQITKMGWVVGTPGYMSPEQLLGGRVDERSDLWSLGCLLYRCVADSPCFPGASSVEINTAVLCSAPAWYLLEASTPRALRELLEALLHREPSHRPPGMREVARLLETILAGESTGRYTLPEAEPRAAEPDPGAYGGS